MIVAERNGNKIAHQESTAPQAAPERTVANSLSLWRELPLRLVKT